jgi:UDP-N-acetylglucosamine:LPS N-acetylglucosamine transferase
MFTLGIKQYQKYFGWTAFTTLVFVLTNAFSSLDLIYRYRLAALDMMLTFGFILFMALLEAALIAGLLIIIERTIRKLFTFNPAKIFNHILLFLFCLSWINLFLTIFKKPLF